MRKVFLLMTTALFSFEAWAQTEECVEAPSCTELGYTRTEDECPTGSVKCPWNTGLVYCECGEDYKYTCDGDNEKAGDSQCNGLYAACACANGYKWENGSCAAVRPSCNIGDIFYTDNTCVAADKHDSSKTVLGIVVYVNDNGIGGQIMAPWPIDGNGNRLTAFNSAVFWSFNYIDIRGISVCQNAEAAALDYNSCKNTNAIVAQDDESVAAAATKKYAPTTATSGKWCLPAAGVLSDTFKNRSVFRNSISVVGGISKPDGYVCSSSLYDYRRVWAFNNKYNKWDLELIGKGGGQSCFIRPVLEF